MANKKTSGSSKKTSSRKPARALPPAVRTIRYELTNSGTPGTETSHFIDLARDLSILNRRLYRQGRVYHVKKISVISVNTISGYAPSLLDPNNFQNAGLISVGVVPYNWVSQKAHQRAFKTWNEMNKIATSQIGTEIQGTWADFKVYLDTQHRAATLLRPLDNGGNQYDLGEWEYSSMVTPDGTTGADDFNLHMLGDHLGSVGAWNSVGLIKSYGESRATVNAGDPNVPNTAKDDPLVNVFDYGTAVDEVIDLLSYNNDNPPYDINEYPGTDTNGPKPMVIQNASIDNGRGSIPGFAAFCGLIELEVKSPIASDVYSVLVELAPGSFRGIKAESI